MNDVKLENVELQEEEVNIYTPACGETRYKCIVIRQIKRCRFHQIKTGLSEHLTMG